MLTNKKKEMSRQKRERLAKCRRVTPVYPKATSCAIQGIKLFRVLGYLGYQSKSRKLLFSLPAQCGAPEGKEGLKNFFDTERIF